MKRSRARGDARPYHWRSIAGVGRGILFLFAGLVAAADLLLENPSIRNALLLALAIWCFCRFYYFAFYVIQHYVDPAYRFSGLGSFLLYLWKSKTR